MTNDITPFYKLPLLSLDTETTGVDVFTERIVTCNFTYDYADGREPYICDWLINPGIPIPEGASNVHGITDDIAQSQGADPLAALTNIANHLTIWHSYGLPIVVYNASFDITLLLAEFYRYGIHCEATFDKVIDPLVLDKGIDPYRKGSRKLTDTAKFYGIVLENAHSADADSLASVKLARKLGEYYEIDAPIAEVHEQQRKWKKSQAESFQEYKRKTDPTAVINGEWPYMSKPVDM